MNGSGKVSNSVIKRLPGYYRYLTDLEEKGMVRISSQELGSRMGLTASQIRQDINCFGEFGQQGYGYNVTDLREQIGHILGLDQKYPMVIVGAGNVGQALAKYLGFRDLGYCVEAMFDKYPERVSSMVEDMPLFPVEELGRYLQSHTIKIGIITAPAADAQKISDILVAGGVEGIWNYAPVDLNVPDDVALQNMHLSDSLMIISYHIRHKE